jgi:hypothetical protein
MINITNLIVDSKDPSIVNGLGIPKERAEEINDVITKVIKTIAKQECDVFGSYTKLDIFIELEKTGFVFNTIQEVIYISTQLDHIRKETYMLHARGHIADTILDHLSGDSISDLINSIFKDKK